NNNNLSYQKDVDALKALHLATNGASWTNKWDLSSNPQAWYGVQWHYNRVWYLDLQNNNLSGTLPQELGNLIELRSFRLNDNNIGGSIPPQLGNLKKLSVFFLHKNKLTGSIPETLGNLTNVEMFYLMDNLLEGPIPPELGNLANAMGMGLSQNKLTGTIPASFGNLTRLTQLMVNDNELQGSLPAQLAYLTTTEIWLDGNRYNFGAFEPLATFFASNTGAILTPQSKLPVEDDFILVDLGESLTVTISTPGSNNRYQWFRGTTSVSSSSASPDFTLTNFQSSMTGKYTCQVTNTALPGKTLLSDEIVIDHPLSFTASVLEIKASSIRLSTQFSHSGTVYAIITTEDKPAPSATQLIAGKDGNNETPVKVISHILQNQNTLVTGLTPNTSYKIYYLGRTSLQQGEVKNISITTLSGILFASTYPKINEVTSNQIKLALKTTIAGTAYFVALPYNSPSPTATQVAAKQDASGTSTTLGSSDILTANTEL
ncbi:MAG TPA: hypothetical protein PLJ08_08910, partial [Cyclobacteriaceae bacterium]|nr:hypothetical protein [Cyclobacteriaceae bacterium]